MLAGSINRAPRVDTVFAQIQTPKPTKDYSEVSSHRGRKARKAISRRGHRTKANRDSEYIRALTHKGHSNFERIRWEAHKEYLRPELEHMDR
jgi:hypothetical protein